MRLRAAADRQLIARDPLANTTPVIGDAAALSYRIEKYLETLPGSVPEGKRHMTAYPIAAFLVRDFGLDVSDAWPWLSRWNIARCLPPLSEKELGVILADAERRGQRPKGSGIERHDVRSRLATGSTVDVPRAQDAAAPLSNAARAVTLAQLQENPEMLRPPQPLVRGLMYAGRSSLLAGRERVGKSTLLTAAVAALSAGLAFLGQPTTAGVVLWVLLEEAVADLVLRLRAYQAAAERVYVLGVGARVTGLSDIVREAERLRPDALIIDTLAKLAHLEGIREAGSSTEWTPLMSALTDLAHRLPTALCLSHHAKKDGSGYRDSTAIGAGVDVILEMEEDARDPTLRVLRVKGRWSMEDLPIRLGDEGYVLATSAPSLRERILSAVGAEPGMSINRLAGVVAKRKQVAAEEAERLIDQGLLVNRGSDKEYALHLPAAPGAPPPATTGWEAVPKVVPGGSATDGREPPREPPADSCYTHGNHSGTATEPPAEPHRFPSSPPREPDREPPPLLHPQAPGNGEFLGAF